MTPIFDTLKAARRLQDEAGFNETQASVLVSTIAQGLSENLATKDDLTRLATKEDLTREIAAVRGEVEVLRGEVQVLRGEIVAVRGEMQALEQRVYVRVGAMVSGATVFLTAVIGIATAILLNAI